jgi:hypothetical protein
MPGGFWLLAGAVYMISGTFAGILLHSLPTVIISVILGTAWMTLARRLDRR